MKSDFEKGREYERLSESSSSRLFFGWSCVIFSFVSLIGVFISKTIPLWLSIFLFVFGCGSLYIGYSERSDLKHPKKRGKTK